MADADSPPTTVVRASAPRGRPPKQPKAERRALVLAIATRHFAEHGRTGTSVDAIAEAADVRKPAIYELFGAKDDLFRACVELAVDDLRANFGTVNAATSDLPLAERTRARVAAAVAHATANPDAFRLLARAPSWWPEGDQDNARRIRNRLVEVMAANYRRESSTSGRPVDVGAEVMARLFFTMSDEIVRLCLDDRTTNPEALIDFLAEFITAGISGVRGRTWNALEGARSG